MRELTVRVLAPDHMQRLLNAGWTPLAVVMQSPVPPGSNPGFSLPDVRSVVVRVEEMK